MEAPLLTALVFVTAALAQDPEPPPEVRYLDKTEIDFLEGVDIHGELVKPRISQVSETRRAVFASFIRLRSDFDEEIRQSATFVR